MDLVHIFLLFLAGAAAGFLAGFFGIGGGIIIVPILILYFHSIGVSSLVATHLALGTSLLVVVFAALSSAPYYVRHGFAVRRAVVLMGAASIIGAFVGSSIAAMLSGKYLQQFFAVVVAVAAVRMFVRSKVKDEDLEPDLRFPGLIVTGLSTGAVSALTGVGGGIFWIPIMHNMLKFPFKKAIGTSSATIVITAAAGCVGYVVRGWGDPLLPSSTLGFV
ncbi:MAG: sulfite exporter TauE/SafE family protein, partial [Ignavibacteria bacterium]|nr:sulfite exporter TauE/SafE family protein [Ignavibacteria bacterium]